MIYHVTTKAAWEQATENAVYEAASLKSEGFIHSSTLAQVPAVLKRYYKNQTDLVLLHIDETKLEATLRYELAPSVNEMFPHIFGTINLNAVVAVETITLISPVYLTV